MLRIRRGTRSGKRLTPLLDQSLLVVRGSRYCWRDIQSLLTGPPPQSADAPDNEERRRIDLIRQQNLRGNFMATLRLCGPDHEAYEYDEFAIEVLVNELRVGYIQKRSAPALRRIIEPFARRGIPIELPCTIFWNGDHDSDFQFYTVQLFS